MKRILVLAEKPSEDKKKLAAYLTRSLIGRAEITLGALSQLSFEIDYKNSRAQLSGKDLLGFDLVIFRYVPKDFLPVAEALGIMLNFLKIKYFDSAYGKIGLTTSKLAGLMKLSLAGLPVMPSFFCWRDKIRQQADFLVEKWGLPLVAKQITGRKGKGVVLVKKTSDLDLLDTNNQFLFQKFYPTDEEYRLLVLGNKVRVWERKIRADKNEFRQNVALGAREEFLNISCLPAEMAQIACQAAQTLNYEIAGVDILVERANGKYWLLEANREPGLTYDEKISPELSQIASFLAQETGIKNGI